MENDKVNHAYLPTSRGPLWAKRMKSNQSLYNNYRRNWKKSLIKFHIPFLFFLECLLCKQKQYHMFLCTQNKMQSIKNRLNHGIFLKVSLAILLHGYSFSMFCNQKKSYWIMIVLQFNQIIGPFNNCGRFLNITY